MNTHEGALHPLSLTGYTYYMPVPIQIEERSTVLKKNKFSAHYIAVLFLSLHWACVLYINSSYLEQFVSHTVLTGLYIMGAVLTIASLFGAPSLLSRYGNKKCTLFLAISEFLIFIGMAHATSPYYASILFILHQTTITLLYFNLDILIEATTGKKEDSTGRQRGIFLTIVSITTAFAPLVIGKLIGSGVPDFSFAYILSALILVPFAYIINTGFVEYKDPQYISLNIKNGIAHLLKSNDLRNVFCAHFLLQFFFTWMVIYTPLYLYSVIGFDWEEIGGILFVGLMAYVLLEYFIGLIADKYIGEKEMMAFGFAVTAVATSWFIFLDNSSIGVWMFAMFMTRVGASFIEATTESYFFKHTNGTNTDVIGLFRITRPLSYVIGATLGGLSLHFLDFEALFIILGLLMVPGMFFAIALNDTR
jgi:MFS family permease